MRALVTRLRADDKRREKVLVTDWPEPKGPTGKQVKTSQPQFWRETGDDRRKVSHGEAESETVSQEYGISRFPLDGGDGCGSLHAARRPRAVCGRR